MPPSSENTRPIEKRRPNKPATMECLHQDTDLFIVVKPAGMWSQSAFVDEPGVRDALQDIDSANTSALRCVYPLERDVSGLMVWARNDETSEQLSKQFANRYLTINFLAIVRAMVMKENGIIDLPLNTSTGPRGLLRIDEAQGQPAVTEWSLRDRYVGFALLECLPRTRIQSQIRAHLQAGQMPLAVDPTYGEAEYLMLSSFKGNYRRSQRRPERPLIQRTTLHAWRVNFDHPRSGEPMQFKAPFPKDFRATLHQLDRFARIPK